MQGQHQKNAQEEEKTDKIKSPSIWIQLSTTWIDHDIISELGVNLSICQ